MLAVDNSSLVSHSLMLQGIGLSQTRQLIDKTRTCMGDLEHTSSYLILALDYQRLGDE